jgi:hypothetical protein
MMLLQVLQREKIYIVRLLRNVSVFVVLALQR